MRRPVYLLGGDAHSAAGPGLEHAVAACQREAVRPALERFDTQMGALSLPYFPFPDAQEPLPRLQAVAESALTRFAPAARGRMGLFIGSSSGLMQEQEQAYVRERAGPDPTAAVPIRHPFLGETAEQLGTQLGLNGPRLTITTACSAGANALLYAAWMIREGMIDDALVVGMEFRNQLSQLGFYSLLLVAPERCQPFDRNRAGVVLGETAAALVLSANKPEGRCWEVLGGGTLCDVSHPTSPSTAKIAETLRAALADAQLDPARVSAVKAHGTGTPSNDLSEGQGIRDVFGRPLPITSIKPVFGHTLGACGVLETLAFTGCLEAGVIPATGGLSENDPQTGVEALRTAVPYAGGPVLLNYFGFGGNNCSLVVQPC